MDKVFRQKRDICVNKHNAAIEDSISDVKGFSEIKIAIQSKLSYA